MKVQQSRYRQAPLNHDDGVQIVDDWVETAMRLSPDELRTLDMLAMLQQREGSDSKALAA
jgi:DSF synthase